MSRPESRLFSPFWRRVAAHLRARRRGRMTCAKRVRVAHPGRRTCLCNHGWRSTAGRSAGCSSAAAGARGRHHRPDDTVSIGSPVAALSQWAARPGLRRPPTAGVIGAGCGAPTSTPWPCPSAGQSTRSSYAPPCQLLSRPASAAQPTTTIRRPGPPCRARRCDRWQSKAERVVEPGDLDAGLRPAEPPAGAARLVRSVGATDNDVSSSRTCAGLAPPRHLITRAGRGSPTDRSIDGTFVQRRRVDAALLTKGS